MLSTGVRMKLKIQAICSRTLLLILFSFSLWSCDKVCKKTTEDFANIQNITGRTLDLTACKGRGYGKVDIRLNADQENHEITLGTREEVEARGGPTASCSNYTDDRADMRIFLTAKSFELVKLCYDESNKKTVITEVQNSCPTGFVTQESAAECATAF